MVRTALITGASSGIGHALSRIFAVDGYDLVLVARRLAKLEEIASNLRQNYAVTVTVLAKDLSQAASLARFSIRSNHRTLRWISLVN